MILSGVDRKVLVTGGGGFIGAGLETSENKEDTRKAVGKHVHSILNVS